MKVKVRCQNCDVVIEVERERFYMSGWHDACRCYYCNSIRTVETDEPYRPPKWERDYLSRLLEIVQANKNKTEES
jgi:hypothetical protein